MKTIHVVAAIIVNGSRVFATQRGYGDWKDYWEFPGGKIEPGESPEAALRREILEELDTEIDVGKRITTIEYDYPDFHLSMECFQAYVTEGSLVLQFSLDEVRIPAFMPSSIALGCNGYEAHMQQILTPYGV